MIKLFLLLLVGGEGVFKMFFVIVIICWFWRESCGKGVFKCVFGDIYRIFVGLFGIMIGIKYCFFEMD